MNELVVYFCGIVTGFMLTTLLVLEMGRRALSKKLDPPSGDKTLTDRMKRIKAITSEQLELNRQIDGPQRNGLDGRYKNGLIGKLKTLEEEKVTILKSILTDGHDPELTTVDEAGVVSQMKLSEYMAYMGIKMEPKKANSAKVSQVGKFTVVKGGRDDGGNTTTH